MKKKAYIYNGEYFYQMVINGFVINIDYDNDSWKKIYNKFLKNKKIMWDQYLQWITNCMGTVLECRVKAMKFEMNFIGGINKKVTFDYPIPHEAHITLFYGRPENV